MHIFTQFSADVSSLSNLAINEMAYCTMLMTKSQLSIRNGNLVPFFDDLRMGLDNVIA